MGPERSGSDGVVVRPATTDDVEGIGRVARAAYRETYPPVLGETVVEELLAEWYSPDSIRESVAGDGDTLVAEEGRIADDGRVAEGGRVVGFASGGLWTGEDRDPGDGILGSLYVHPDQWGEGIGTRLYGAVRSWLEDRGLDRMWIHVFADNEVAGPFYRERARRVDRRVDELAGNEYEVDVYVDRFDAEAGA